MSNLTRTRVLTVAVAAFGTLLLASTLSASAATSSENSGNGFSRGGGGARMSAPRMNYGMRSGGFHPNTVRWGGYGGKQSSTPGWPGGKSSSWKPGNHPGCYGGRCGGQGSNWRPGHWPYRPWYSHWRRPYYTPGYTSGYVSAPSYVAPAPSYVEAPTYQAPAPTYVAAPTYQAPAPAYQAPVAAAPCTCLKKEYTQDGQVVFRDVCTNEALSGPTQQAQQQSQQQPQYQQQ